MDEQKNNSGKIFGIVCILVALLVLGYIFRNDFFKKSLSDVSRSVTSSASSFSSEVDTVIDRFIFTKIDMLSPIPAPTGTVFAVSTIAHEKDGERIVVYSDRSSTYVAKGVFSLSESKQINIVEFDLLPSTQDFPEDLALAKQYFAEHLSELSPEKEVLGGKFYITKTVFENHGNAVIEYEDGHNAFKAHVSFLVDGGKNVEVLKWEMLSAK